MQLSVLRAASIYNIRGIRKIFKSGESLLRFNYESTFVFKMYVYIHFIKQNTLCMFVIKKLKFLKVSYNILSKYTQ